MAAHGKSVCKLQGKATCGTWFRKKVSGPGKSRIRKKKNQKKKNQKKKNQKKEESGKRRIRKNKNRETEQI
jgi:hypothetical protein